MPDHEEEEYDDTNNTEDFGSMTGGSKTQKKNEESFFEYMSSFTNAEKGHILNMIQYSGIAILPILTILKESHINGEKLFAISSPHTFSFDSLI